MKKHYTRNKYFSVILFFCNTFLYINMCSIDCFISIHLWSDFLEWKWFDIGLFSFDLVIGHLWGFILSSLFTSHLSHYGRKKSSKLVPPFLTKSIWELFHKNKWDWTEFIHCRDYSFHLKGKCLVQSNEKVVRYEESRKI